MVGKNPSEQSNIKHRYAQTVFRNIYDNPEKDAILKIYTDPEKTAKHMTKCLEEGNTYGAFTTARLHTALKYSNYLDTILKEDEEEKAKIIYDIKTCNWPALTRKVGMEFLRYSECSDICKLAAQISKEDTELANKIIIYVTSRKMLEMQKTKEIDEIAKTPDNEKFTVTSLWNLIRKQTYTTQWDTHIEETREAYPEIDSWYDTVYPEYPKRNKINNIIHLPEIPNITTKRPESKKPEKIDYIAYKAYQSIIRENKEKERYGTLFRYFFPKKEPPETSDTVHHQQPQARPQNNDSHLENPVYLLP